VTFRFPAVAGGAGKASDTFGGVTGWAVTTGASPDAMKFLKYLTSLDNQKLGGGEGLFIPVAKGADVDIKNPFFQKMSASLIGSTNHQLFLDQALGSDVGATVNDVAADLAQGAITPKDAAKSVQDAWSKR
jgi:raffinose/stachyose/melibiose transport system substrate-binding protein